MKDKAAYRQKSFTSRNVVDLQLLGIQKDQQWAQINICPIQYLPSENVIRVYYFIEFEVIIDKQPPQAKAINKSTTKTVPNAKVYQIISDRKFENTLAPFIDWKIQKGFDVRVAYTDQPEVGTTNSSIKTYLKGIYESADRADYLLLVGDTDEIPAFPTSFSNSHWLIEGAPHVTDLYYAEYTGDYFPDVYYGRLSANTPQDLNNQIEKILAMEQLTIPSTDFLEKSTLIAGWESDSDFIAVLNATVNYGTENYFNASNNITETVYLSPNSRTQAAAIISNINNGAAFVNYTAHGDWNEWYAPNVQVSDVLNLTNIDKYPFIIGNCCLTNKFEIQSACFGESLLRAPQKGAVAYIGASNSTYFEEDFQWSVGAVNRMSSTNYTYQNTGLGVYDRIFHTHGEPVTDWANTVGEILFFGNMAVQLGNATYNNEMKKYYWEIYHIMGDPSYNPYMFKPQPLICNHEPQISALSNLLIIETEPFAYAGFSMNGQLLSAGQADYSGLLILDFSKPLTPGNAQLVVTAPNHSPYKSTVTIMPANSPLIDVNDYKLSINANAVPYPVFGETVDFSIALKNISNFDASNVSIKLCTDTTFVKIIQSSDTASVLAALDSVWITNLQLIISPEIPNHYNIQISAIISYCDTLSILRYFNFTAAAPEWSISGFTITDENGALTLTNSGLAALPDAQIQLTGETTEVTVDGLLPTSANFTPNTAVPITFNLARTHSAPAFLPFILNLTIQKGHYSYQTQIHTAFGNLIEDFERGYFHDSIWWHEEGDTFEWSTDSLTFYEKRFSMKSAQINDKEYCDMYTQNFDVIGGDSIIFYYKVSSEDCSEEYGTECGDALEFYVATLTGERYDLERMAAYYGEIPWTRAAFPVKKGIQFFNWSYIKDQLESDGQDCAWVDYITFPKMKHMPNVPSNPTSTADRIPDHIAFDVVVTNQQLHARINAETPSKATIWLTNMLGQPVGTIASNNPVNTGQNDFYFDLSNLPKGVYICTCFDGNRTLSRKIVHK